MNDEEARMGVSPAGLQPDLEGHFIWPGHVHFDGQRYFVTETNAHRVLMWNSVPNSPADPADVVIGQTDLQARSSSTAHTPSASTLKWPSGVASDGTRLVVSDTANHRVLVWTSLPTAHNTPADLVLGQPHFLSNAAQNGGLSASSLHSPESLLIAEGKLLVVDAYNNRVLIWNEFPTSVQEPADLVLGQANFSTNDPNAGGVSARSLSLRWQNTQMAYQNGVFLLSDPGNNRVLGWWGLPTVSHQSADFVLGQDDFVSNAANKGGAVAEDTLSGPRAVALDHGFVWMGDAGNERLIRMPLPPAP